MPYIIEDLKPKLRYDFKVYLGVKTSVFFFVFYLCCLARFCTLLFQYLLFSLFFLLVSLAVFFTEVEPDFYDSIE